MITANDNLPFSVTVGGQPDLHNLIKQAFFIYAPDRMPTDRQIEFLIEDYERSCSGKSKDY